MASTFALASGVLFGIVALIEVLMFRGTTTTLFHFAAVQNAFHWVVGVFGIAAMLWGRGRVAFWYSRVCGVFLFAVGLAGLFAPVWVERFLHAEVNMPYGVLYIGFGIAGLFVGFFNKMKAL